MSFQIRALYGVGEYSIAFGGREAAERCSEWGPLYKVLLIYLRFYKQKVRFLEINSQIGRRFSRPGKHMGKNETNCEMSWEIIPPHSLSMVYLDHS